VLINFSVTNFRSFGAEETLNLVASGKLKDHPDHCIPIDQTGKSVLRAAVVYGANAAGKSNLVRAIDFAQDLILGVRPINVILANQFRFAKKKTPSSFEFRFLVDGRIFTYGFSVNQKGVVREWLAATTKKGREVEVFDREAQNISISDLKSFGEDGKTSAETLKALRQLGARHDQLLLNRIVELESSRRGQLLDQVAWWIQTCLAVIEPESTFSHLLEFLSEDAAFRQFAGVFLDNVGTGIKDLHIERTKIGADKIPKQLLEALQSAKDAKAALALGGVDVSMELDPKDPATVIRRNLAADHRVEGSDYSLPFHDESDGTQRCLHLLPALYHLTKSCKVFVVDELDRSLHPLLCHALLKLFVDSCPGACQQMIVTTHETHLLDLDLLRRDEIWFVERDEKQQTRLHSLADMRIRNDVRIEKGYLQGRFGGIPFIGDTKKLMDLIECPTNGKRHAKKAPAC
jgi:uncharacterized protein